MKKFISLCLVVFVIFSVCAFTVNAQTDNLLVNGDFEKGNTENWDLNGPDCKVEAVKEAAHSGKYGVSISNRTGKYSTIAQDIYETYYNNGAGKYKASVWIKLTNAVSERVKCQLVISYTEGGKAMRWITSRAQSLTTQWQEFVIETDIKINVYELESMLIYPQVESASSETNYDFCFDDMTFVKVSEVIKPDPNYMDMDVVDNAKTPNLIENGNFETGDEEGADIEGTVVFEVDADYKRTGEYGMLVTERYHKYSTVRWDLRDAFYENGPGQYRACVFIRLNVDEDATEEEKNLETVCEFVIRYGLKGDTTKYIATGKKKITTKWTKIVLDRELDFDPTQVRELVLYPQVLTDNPDYLVDFCVDDVTLYKTTDIIAPDPNYKPLEDIKVDTSIPVEPIDVTNVNRVSGPTSVGVIRWDAWYGSDNTPNSVISAVEKTLSPAEFHFRAPFFAETTSDNKIIIPEYTQEIFDKEMEYAIEAGIDYFAFYWYTDSMQKARQFYKTSKYNDKVKMCVMLAGSTNDADQHHEIAELLQQDYYMTVLGGRPLMYYDCDYTTAKSEIAYYRRLCKQLNIPEPYAVCTKASSADAEKAVADAIGDYAVSNDNNMTFFELTKKAERRWLEHQRNANQYVPIVTTGYHLLPRYKNQVFWMSVGSDEVAEYATSEEIATHLTAALNYMQKTEVVEKTKANTVLMYAWNEHDEGGWICPTLKVDENGKQLYDENGEKLIDTTRIEAVKKAIADFKENYTDPVISTPTTNNGNTNEPGNNGGISNVITMVVFGGGTILLVGAVITIIVVIKKKKNNGVVDDEQ